MELPAKQVSTIFVSYYDMQMLKDIETVFDTLEALDPAMDNLERIDRNQSSSIETLSSRIAEIRACSSAIVCFPPDDLSDSSIKYLAYLDLGACLVLFPERTLLVYQENDIKNIPLDRVGSFQYLGNLDFQQGMELAKMILAILQRSS